MNLSEGFILFVAYTSPIWMFSIVILLELAYSKDDFVGPFPPQSKIACKMFSLKRQWKVLAALVVASCLALWAAVLYCRNFEATYQGAGITAYVLFLFFLFVAYAATHYQANSQFSKSAIALKWVYLAVAMLFWNAPDFMKWCSAHHGCYYSSTPFGKAHAIPNHLGIVI